MAGSRGLARSERHPLVRAPVARRAPPDRDPNKIGAIVVCVSAATDILLPMHQSFA
ncbi:hypothetical protein Scani_62250 [Streptomyces caniferus]|uniref:Uncharacterized protein n=1 Tax=Streptomyces caniferus TaxID=285557 RepID=A0A640SFJ4_9ACTN|nr:hypothetical protein Scani_62250 [Streptomyces caniferus]